MNQNEIRLNKIYCRKKLLMHVLSLEENYNANVESEHLWLKQLTTLLITFITQNLEQTVLTTNTPLVIRTLLSRTPCQFLGQPVA